MQPEEPVRVLLVDDHTLLREAVSSILAAEPDLEVVGDTADGRAAVALAARLRPTVVLLDVQIPDNHVLATVRGLLHAAPLCAVVILSMHDDPRLVRQVLAAGASSFLHKSVGRADLAAAVRAAAANRRRVVTVAVPRGAYDPPRPRAGGPVLSEREQQVLTLVAKARTNRQIAAELGITEGTVKRHLRNVFQKLDAVSRIDAVNRATAAQLVPRS